MDFCKKFNARTKKQDGMIIPVVITVFADRTFDFITKSPPAAVLLKIKAGLDKGSPVPNRQKVGTVTVADCADIAKMKIEDLNTSDMDAAVRMIKGTARSMGIDVLE